MIEQQTTLTGFRNTKSYYTTREVAELYKVTPTTVCNWLRAGWLKGDKVTDQGKDAKHERRHWHIWPGQLEDMELRRDELIAESRRYWMRIYRKMR